MNYEHILLDEKENQIYNLRQQGLTYKQIAEKVGLSSSTVSLYFKRAEHTVILTEWLQQKITEFDEPSGITLTKGDVRVMLDALLLWERAQLRRKERQPVNEYQQEYLERKRNAFEKLKKQALICTMGEKKYNMLPDEFK